MIVMDRENLLAKGWSHVVSTTNDVGELDAFRLRVGAPAAALQLANPRWPHLDLRGEPRERALALADIVIVDRTSELIRYVRRVRGRV
ncbi:MAG TPA: hypothetical protein VJ847_03560 [Gemmatimonadales bacterium]|jgi:hypothetical protein|nr:hypothetical protein [Gemmatimonadales bacterium]